MLLLAAALGQATAPRTPPVVLQDQFGRDLAQVGVTLVDWEGRIANPAIRLRLVPGPRLYLPARIRLSASGERLMFDLWSEVGPNGPTKTLFLESDRKPATFYMSTFPDTDGEDERHTLKVEVTDANESTSVLEFPIRVLDQDRPRRGLEFGLELDFGQDKSGFFADSKPRELASTAAADWAYFLAAMPFDPVPAEAEKTFVFDSGGYDNRLNDVNAVPAVSPPVGKSATPAPTREHSSTSSVSPAPKNARAPPPPTEGASIPSEDAAPASAAAAPSPWRRAGTTTVWDGSCSNPIASGGRPATWPR